ncbi:MAG: MipA/OmpV family protein [Caulobacter sp.]|nr:MipA/OmpV family protein [Caulobacter sp.]
MSPTSTAARARIIAIVSALFACLAEPCLAAEQAPSSYGPWTVDVGLAARLRPVHLGASRYTTDLLPILEVNYGDRLTFSLDDGLTLALWRSGGWSAGPVVEYRQSYNDRLPRRAYTMDDAVEIGGFIKRRTAIGEFELRTRKAVSGYDGWSGDLAFDTGGQVAPNWKVGAEARLSWADSSFSREYFGLRRNPARSMSLPRFGENDFYSAGVELDAARAIGPRLSIVATISEDRILGEEWESPLLASRNIVTAGLGLTYRFGRLAEPGEP